MPTRYRLIKPLKGFETGESFTLLRRTIADYFVMSRDARPEQEVSFSAEIVKALFKEV